MLFRGTKLRVGSAFAVGTIVYVLSVGPIFSAHAQTPPTCDGRQAMIVGTEGDDVLVGTSDDDVIVGLSGSDTIDGGDGGGQDALCGNDGNDQVEGPDTTWPESNDAYLSGGDGNDLLLGGSSGDAFMAVRMDGGPGDDTLDGRTAVEQTYGHLADYSDSPTAVIVDLGTGIATGEGTDTLFDMEGVVGSALDDELYGDEDAFNVISGQEGSDTVFGRGGSDLVSGGRSPLTHLWEYDESAEGSNFVSGGEGTDHVAGGNRSDELYGGPGDDRIRPADGDDRAFGGTGNDDMGFSSGNNRLHGGPGTDFMVFRDNSSNFSVRADFREGISRTVLFGETFGTDTVSLIENIVGSYGDDVLLGNSVSNRFTGGRGEDVIKGRGGDDFLRGQARNDRIDGGPGFDEIDGGGGNNDRCSRGEVYIRCEGAL